MVPSSPSVGRGDRALDGAVRALADVALTGLDVDHGRLSSVVTARRAPSRDSARGTGDRARPRGCGQAPTCVERSADHALLVGLVVDRPELRFGGAIRLRPPCVERDGRDDGLPVAPPDVDREAVDFPVG